MSYAKIILEREGPLAIIRLNDPAHLNAIDHIMRNELVEAMNGVLGDDNVRAVLMMGVGRAFCAGANLKNMFADQARGITPDVGTSLRDGIIPMLLRMTEAKKPIVAAVSGAAVGVGCGLALAADIVLADRSAYFFQSFVRIGVVPDGGSSWVIPRLVGRGRATAMMMLGDKIGAEQALDWGLVHRLYENADLAAGARELALGLANGPTAAYAKLKKMLAHSSANSLAEQLELETALQQEAFDTRDCREGIAAFIEGRPPQFSGT